MAAGTCFTCCPLAVCPAAEQHLLSAACHRGTPTSRLTLRSVLYRFVLYHVPPRSGPEYQAEVGLLSRNILIQGDAAAERSRRGPHVRVEGAARIRGVQAFRVGQVGWAAPGGRAGRGERRPGHPRLLALWECRAASIGPGCRCPVLA